MILRRRREADRQKVDSRLLELQAAKEILAEIFHARPRDIEDMIRDRLLERSWAVEQMPASDGLWLATSVWVNSYGPKLRER
jgi:hypothetical protein